MEKSYNLQLWLIAIGVLVLAIIGVTELTVNDETALSPSMSSKGTAIVIDNCIGIDDDIYSVVPEDASGDCVTGCINDRNNCHNDADNKRNTCTNNAWNTYLLDIENCKTQYNVNGQHECVPGTGCDTCFGQSGRDYIHNYDNCDNQRTQDYQDCAQQFQNCLNGCGGNNGGNNGGSAD